MEHREWFPDTPSNCWACLHACEGFSWEIRRRRMRRIRLLRMRCAAPALARPLPCCFLVKYPDNPDHHGLFPLARSAVHLNPSLDSVWMKQTHPHSLNLSRCCFGSLCSNRRCWISCRAVQTAIHPILDLPPSTFSKNFDFFFSTFLDKVWSRTSKVDDFFFVDF